MKKSTNAELLQMINGVSGGAPAPAPRSASGRARRAAESFRAAAAAAAGGGGGETDRDQQQKAQQGSVSKKFLLGLKQLMREIATTHPFFIRCIKPTNNLTPGEFHTCLRCSRWSARARSSASS